ncbi:MAG TPA: tetratricopeptide repeat protein [Terracidiphilus sp.]
MRLLPATSLMLLCAALPVDAAHTPVDNPGAALPAIAITTPITFTLLATSQNGVNYPPLQQQGGRYIIPVQPQQPYQRACGTTATDICEVPVAIPPGASAEQVYQLANQALGRHQLGQQLAYIRKSAEMGYDRAEYVLGEYYLTHRIAENDWPQKGAYWLGLSASQGNGAAQLALGIELEDGKNNVPRDQARAIELFKAAAAQHQGLAELRLGLDYEFANGLPHNRPLAIQYLRRAAADGVPTATAKADFLAKSSGGRYQSLGELDAAMYPTPAPRKLKPGECPYFQTVTTGPYAQAQKYQFCQAHPGCPSSSAGWSGPRCPG